VATLIQIFLLVLLSSFFFFDKCPSGSDLLSSVLITLPRRTSRSIQNLPQPIIGWSRGLLSLPAVAGNGFGVAGRGFPLGLRSVTNVQSDEFLNGCLHLKSILL
jgi:hypothetical protein